MFDVGSGELMLILLVALMLFGGKLPDVGRSIGRSVNSFRKGLQQGVEPLREVENELRREEPPAKPDPPKAGGASPAPTTAPFPPPL